MKKFIAMVAIAVVTFVGANMLVVKPAAAATVVCYNHQLIVLPFDVVVGSC